MFKVGDVVRIKKEWLEEHEDPNTDYVVMEDYGDGKVKVWVESKTSAFGGYYYVFSNVRKGESNLFFAIRVKSRGVKVIYSTVVGFSEKAHRLVD